MKLSQSPWQSLFWRKNIQVINRRLQSKCSWQPRKVDVFAHLIIAHNQSYFFLRGMRPSLFCIPSCEIYSGHIKISITRKLSIFDIFCSQPGGFPRHHTVNKIILRSWMDRNETGGNVFAEIRTKIESTDDEASYEVLHVFSICWHSMMRRKPKLQVNQSENSIRIIWVHIYVIWGHIKNSMTFMMQELIVYICKTLSGIYWIFEFKELMLKFDLGHSRRD